jgi:dihydrofolate reductase
MKLIVATDPNGGIGYNNKLPWSKIEGDLPRFKELTSGKVIIMGRNTWESLPVKPLPNRINVVVSSTDISGITTINSLPEKDYMDLSDVWLIGGARLINSSWHLIEEVYLTKVSTEYTCDTFIDLSKINREFSCWFKESHNDHTYEIWKRKPCIR